MLDIELRSFLQRTVDETGVLQLLATAAEQTGLAFLLLAARDEASARLALLPPEVWKV